ncbi:hypothetical protein BJ742DRAFT_163625 [Cladochytrium replicatum]|nr:hypothetical protein BJ742DRAFT_163625 [Cladochytrium replicatum]
MSSTAFELTSSQTQVAPQPLENQILGLPWKVFAAFVGIFVAAILVIVIITYVLCTRRHRGSFSKESKSRSSSSRSKSDVLYSAIDRSQSGDENILRRTRHLQIDVSSALDAKPHHRVRHHMELFSLKTKGKWKLSTGTTLRIRQPASFMFDF